MDVYWIADGKTEQRKPSELAELLARRDGLLWVDVPECDDEARCVLADAFHFHTLAIRDCAERCHIPKLHTYPDHAPVRHLRHEYHRPPAHRAVRARRRAALDGRRRGRNALLGAPAGLVVEP